MLTTLRARCTAVNVTVRAARVEADLAAERTAAAAVRHDRGRRLRDLADGPFLLLDGIGAGRFDPFDDEVRLRSAALAAALRRTLARQAGQPSLITTLEPALRAAEDRGVSIEVQVAGGVDDLPAGVTDDVRETLATILATVTDGRLLLTLTGSASGGSVLLTGAAPSTAVPPPWPGRRVDVIEDSDETSTCVEIRWAAPEPA